ncbi:hypothetical protein FRC07_008370, partial [Ceratobasidium sp. 392]
MSSARRSSRTRFNPEVKASLELRDITVTIGNASNTSSTHEALDGYRYDGPVDDTEAICWMAIPPEGQFCIHIGYNGIRSPPFPNVGIQSEVYIDGIGPVCDAFMTPESIAKRLDQEARGKPITNGEIEMDGQILDGGIIRPLCFSERQTTDN